MVIIPHIRILWWLCCQIHWVLLCPQFTHPLSSTSPFLKHCHFQLLQYLLLLVFLLSLWQFLLGLHWWLFPYHSVSKDTCSLDSFLCLLFLLYSHSLPFFWLQIPSSTDKSQIYFISPNSSTELQTYVHKGLLNSLLERIGGISKLIYSKWNFLFLPETNTFPYLP